MKIQAPAIFIEGTTIAFTQYAHKYNGGKTSLKNKIRHSHIVYFDKLVKAMAINLMQSRLSETDIESIPPLKANNNLLLNIEEQFFYKIELDYTPRDFKTNILSIQNRIKWLEEVQAINTEPSDEKGFINIRISPKLLFLYNVNNVEMQHPDCFKADIAFRILRNALLDPEVEEEFEVDIYRTTRYLHGL